MRTAPVCAIIPTFNRAMLLDQAIVSLVEQTLVPSRILIIDDGSTDTTASVVARFGTVVQYLHQENAGKSVALNRALEVVNEPFVWVFDDDDIADPTALERLYGALTKDPVLGFSYGDHDELRIDARGGRRFVPALVPTPHGGNGLHAALLNRCLIHQPGMLVRRSCFDQLGGFDPSLLRSQDYDMLLRLSRRFVGVRVDGIIFHQRQHPGRRGPASLSVQASDKSALWKRFDQYIFERIYRDYGLAEYLPGSYPNGLSAKDRCHALVRRASLMGQKGLWQYVWADMEALRIAAPVLGLRAFSPYDLANIDLMLDRSAPGLAALDPLALGRAIRRLPSGRMQRQIGARLAAAAPAILRASARHRYPRLFRLLRALRDRIDSVRDASRRPARNYGSETAADYVLEKHP